jgi:hypothetical protein
MLGEAELVVDAYTVVLSLLVFQTAKAAREENRLKYCMGNPRTGLSEVSVTNK